MANRPKRFPDFEYAGFNRYFLTVCVNSRAPEFLNIDRGLYVATHLLHIADFFAFDILAYCVMPDHVHFLVAGQTDNALLRPFMKRWKQETTRGNIR